MKKTVFFLAIACSLLANSLFGWTVYFNNQTSEPAIFDVFTIDNQGRTGVRIIKSYEVKASSTSEYHVGAWCPGKVIAWFGVNYNARITQPAVKNYCGSDVQVNFYKKADGSYALDVTEK